MVPSNKPITIAILTDAHYGEGSAIPARRADIADILLKRAVSRLNRLIRPDVTLLLGDILDKGDAPDAEKRLLHLRKILDELESPRVAVPGNHDSSPDAFYRVFKRPNDIEEISGARFLPFIDPEEPGFNARRVQKDINRFTEARHGFDGPIVSLQHVCLFPPGKTEAPYNYTNADEIITAMKQSGVSLSVSGHYHRGAENTREGGVTFVNAPAICETPFCFLTIRIGSGRAEARRHQLAMPPELGLIDTHVHTELAYCGENMTADKAIDLSKEFGLGGLVFTEHSRHLYFSRHRSGSSAWFEEGLDVLRPEENRIRDYLEIKKRYEQTDVHFGIEADCDSRGNLLLQREDSTRFSFIIGAVHRLPGITDPASPDMTAEEYFLFLVEKLVSANIDVLAHPFRVFRRSGRTVPAGLFAKTARLLRVHGTAAEINFHTNSPPVEFIRDCLRQGVKVTFASDAHHLSEIGDFTYHLALLKEAGFDGPLSDILAVPAAFKSAF